MSKFPYDIFISYSQKDREAAEKLQATFEAHKLKSDPNAAAIFTQ